MSGKVIMAALLGALLLLMPLTAGAQAAITPECVRLHVVADDNSAYKQGLKLIVRNAVREAAASLLEDCPDAESAYERLSDEQDALEEAARAVLREWDVQDDVQVELGVFPFPTRTYAGVTLPEGEYRAVRVVLGRGAGHNWWCVLYPSLCVDAEADASLVFYSSLGRWLKRLWEAVIA